MKACLTITQNPNRRFD